MPVWAIAAEVEGKEGGGPDELVTELLSVDFADFLPGQPSHNPDSDFRAHCKAVFLTLSGVKDEGFTKESIMKQLEAKCPGGCEEIIVCKEKHANPANKDKNIHYHVYMKAKGEFDTVTMEFFALKSTLGGQVHLVHVLKAKAGAEHRQRMVEYVRKDGDVIQKLKGDIAYPSRKRNWAEVIMGKKSWEEARDYLKLHYPNIALRSGMQIKKNWEEMHKPLPQGPKHKIEDFNLPPGTTLEDLTLTKALVLHGLPGSGKTCLAKALGLFPLVVNEVEDLHRLQAGHTHVVFNDMNFGERGLKWTGEQIIALLDMDDDTSIRCRHINAKLPAGLPRVFTTNSAMAYPHDHIFPAGINADQLEGINRRYTKVAIKEDLRRMNQ